MEKIKIVLLIDSLSRGGGAERQFVGLAKGLQKIGFDVCVIAYYPNRGYVEDLEDACVKVKILTSCSGKFRKLRNVSTAISQENPSIVITYKDGPNTIACILKILGAKWKLVVSDRNTTQFLSKSLKVQYNLLYRFADAIVPNSFSQQQFIDTYFPFLSSKVRVITNFTDTELFHPKRNFDNSLVWKHPHILVVARIAQQKNVKGFIEAINALPAIWKEKIHVDWYGKSNVGEDQYAEECQDLIKRYKLQSIFEFKTPVADIQNIYRRYEIFCLPSLWEGFPNVLCEAMASGLLVTASDICDNERIVTDGYNGVLFNPEVPEDIAKTLNKVLYFSPMEVKKYGNRARIYAIENLSFKGFIEKYNSLINELIISSKE